MELGVWSWLCVGGWLRVCVCVWRYVKEGKGEVRGEGWRRVVEGHTNIVSGATTSQHSIVRLW